MTAINSSELKSYVDENVRDLFGAEACVTLSNRDFAAFNAARNDAFAPNAALQNALNLARQVKRAPL